MILINDDCFNYLHKIKDKSIDLILVDPPYLISRDSNFKNYSSLANKEIIHKYGSLSIDFGEWDKGEIDWDKLFKEYYRILKSGGTLIIFFDIWKSSLIKELADKYKFKQPRVCSWVKTNPVPINSKINYLSNASEYFFTFIKSKKPTFNSQYDNGVYSYPICHGKERLAHPTQKPLSLINDLILKHSNPGDVVLDNFAGSGTTGHSCLINNRDFILVERDKRYFNIMEERIEKIKIEYENSSKKLTIG
jgi:DNA modification methylase